MCVREEIKLIVMSLIARATPTLLEGKFEVADPLNTVRLSLSPTVAFRSAAHSSSS